MHRALERLPGAATDPDVLVDHETFDDAGVVRLAPDLALIQTVDFFTPIVDDPRDYGRIAAANALSDVYAMGGTPRAALNLVCWPPSGLDLDVLGEILAGGMETMLEAGCSVVGGHSVEDEELKFGYAVTGVVHPDRIVTNATARPGDALVLTKPLGTGILTTALKRRTVEAADIADAVASMKALSASAIEVGLEHGVRAATDVTGFGLAGHAVQLADASGVSLAIRVVDVPRFERAEELAESGHVPGGGERARDYFGPRVAVDAGIGEGLLRVAFDPQTSGGLLLAIPEREADACVVALRARGWDRAARIGAVEPRGPSAVRLVDGS